MNTTKQTLTESEKSDLSRIVEGWMCGTSKEVLLVREIAKQGMDYDAGCEFAISKLGANRNALNTAINQQEGTVSLNYI